MSKIFSVFIISSIILFSSCLKEKHSIRVKNNYYTTVYKVVVGSAQLGSVSPNQTSSYQPINTGNFSISGYTDTQTLSGSGSVKGKGTHKWTFTLNANGTFSFAEDKK